MLYYLVYPNLLMFYKTATVRQSYKNKNNVRLSPVFASFNQFFPLSRQKYFLSWQKPNPALYSFQQLNLIIKIGIVCLYHCQHTIGDRRYCLAPCDKHKHTGHAHQQAATQASTDSAWRYPVWLAHSSLGFQCPVVQHYSD